MKRLLHAGLALAILALAACGSGGSSGGGGYVPPPVSPPTTAPLAATLAYSWSGALAPGGATQTFSVGRYTLSASPTPTPIPVLSSVCDPRSNDCRPPGQQQSPASNIDPTINVVDLASPEPNPMPSAALVMPGSLTVQPEPSSAPYTYTYMQNVALTHTCGNATATVGSHNLSIPVCVFPSVTIGCAPTVWEQPGGGYSTSVTGGWSFDQNAPETTIASSDMYMTGPTCTGDFNATYGGPLEYRVYFPYGATAVARTANTIATISPSQWTNTFTMVRFYNGQGMSENDGCGADLDCIVLFKTAAGSVVALQMTYAEDNYYVSNPNPCGQGSPCGDYFTAAYSVGQSGTFAH
ncbi:MAG: hypothetical protein ACYCUI_07065 [Vulcanimicrobiaceae bacterium]